jgi:CRP-like cAMP-binding protein
MMTVSPLAFSKPADPFSLAFDPRSLLLSESDRLWQINSGLVRSLTWLEDGSIVALGVWGAGDIVGKSLSTVEPYQIECLTKVEAVLLPPTDLSDLAETLFAHIQQAEALTLIRSYKRCDMMLLKFLAWLGKRFGQQVAAGRLLDLRLTHQDLSEFLGATRVTITRTLSQLEQQGMIQRLSLKRIIIQEEELWHYEI